MILYTTGYLFVVLAATLSAIEEPENWQAEGVASVIFGLLWPLYLSVRLISRIVK